MHEFKFILQDPRGSTRDKEILDSDARAHAAAVSHRRRRRQEHIATLCQALELSSIHNVSPQDAWNMELLLLNGGAIEVYDPWQLSRGFRNDPFECVPGSNDDVQAVAFEYCEYC